MVHGTFYPTYPTFMGELSMVLYAVSTNRGMILHFYVHNTFQQKCIDI